jgi:large subunit ribosomal protein L9
MKIILTDDVVGLGDIGETVSVKPGYARNFLIPRGLAIETESASARATEHRRRQIDSKKRRMRGTAEERAKALQGFTLRLEIRTGESGRVFGSVSARDIASKLAEHGYELDRRRVLLSEPLKKLGEHLVRIKLHQEVESEIKVVLVSRESTKDEQQADVDSAREALEQGAAERRAAEDDTQESPENAE